MPMNRSSRPRNAAPVEASPQLAALTLPELRAVRADLINEEERVSYWRRLVHARLDILLAAERGIDRLTETELMKALGDTGSGARRRQLSRLRTDLEPLPDLPGLASLWREAVDPEDVERAAQVAADLRTAEHKLGEYRNAVHAQLAEVTGELIARYVADPTACLDLLPA